MTPAERAARGRRLFTRGLFAAIALTAGAIAVTRLNRDLGFFNANTLTVKADRGFDPTKLRVSSGPSLIDADEPRSLERLRTAPVIFDGSRTHDFAPVLAENDFLVLYDQRRYALFRHRKTNPRLPHDYRLRLFTKAGQPYVEVVIDGVDKDRWELLMKPVPGTGTER